MGESIASNGVAKIIDINDEMLKKNWSMTPLEIWNIASWKLLWRILWLW
jgi:hypothetical protein